MAYQNVGTPRFYVDYISWLSSLGWNMHPEGVSVGINPSSLNYSNEVTSPQHQICRYGSPDQHINIPSNFKFDFMAILGHNIASVGADDATSDPHFRDYNDTEHEVLFKGVVNFGYESLGYISPQYDGFTIAEITSHANYEIVDIAYINLTSIHLSDDIAAGNLHIGAFLWGGIYNMPHSPELSLTMTREMDGFKRIRTKGGTDLVDYRYIKPENWGTLAAWELSKGSPPNQALSRSGRRSWDLDFNYLDGSDIFGPNQSLWYEAETPSPNQNMIINDYGYDFNDLEISGPITTGLFNYNILDDDNFYSQVIHKTNGGQLPFIFQPDNSNNNPDQFAICKLDMKSFKFEQVANGVYNIKLKIREVW